VVVSMSSNIIASRKSYINMIDISIDYPPSKDLSFNVTAVNIDASKFISPITFYPNAATSKTSLRFKSNKTMPLFLTASSVESWRVSVIDKSAFDHNDQYQLKVSLKGLSARGITSIITYQS